tara:strand:- start:377 stop:2065 length:1689 start_codon:yes stop_codon:yes gene_type:complete
VRGFDSGIINSTNVSIETNFDVFIHEQILELSISGFTSILNELYTEQILTIQWFYKNSNDQSYTELLLDVDYDPLNTFNIVLNTTYDVGDYIFQLKFRINENQILTSYFTKTITITSIEQNISIYTDKDIYELDETVTITLNDTSYNGYNKQLYFLESDDGITFNNPQTYGNIFTTNETTFSFTTSFHNYYKFYLLITDTNNNNINYQSNISNKIGIVQQIFLGLWSAETNFVSGDWVSSTTSSDGPKFDNPIDIVITPDSSTLYVSDSDNNKIKKIRTSDGFTSLFISTENVSNFNKPKTIAINSDGSKLYVLHGTNYNMKILQITLNTDPIIYIDTPISNQGIYNYGILYGMCVDNDDRYLYITCRYFNRIIKIELNNANPFTFHLVAGYSGDTANGSSGDNVNRMNNPTNIIFNRRNTSIGSKDYLIFVDGDNKKIRQVDLSNNIDNNITDLLTSTNDDGTINKIFEITKDTENSFYYSDESFTPIRTAPTDRIKKYSINEPNTEIISIETGFNINTDPAIPYENTFVFTNPSGIVVNKEKTFLYLVDRGKHCIISSKL